MKRKLKQVGTLALLAVLVLALMGNSACDPTTPSDSWGTSSVTSQLTSSMTQTPEDYVDEYNALDEAFVDMEDLLDELASAIEAAKEATEDCGDITGSLVEALAANNTETARLLLAEGEETLESANSVYESLLDAIEAVETELVDINDLIGLLKSAGQDTSAYDIESITNTVTAGKSAATDLLAAMDDLEDVLLKARELLGVTQDFTLYIAPNQGGSGGSGGSGGFGYDILFLEWGGSARYVRHTQAIDVIDLYVLVAGDDLSYQWYANTTNSNIGGTPISGATNRTYKPSTQNEGIIYYYCVVSAPSGSSVSSPTILVQVFSSQAELNLRITRKPEDRMYMQGETVSEERSLFIEATGENVGYQWYAGSSTDPNATLIPGATQNRFAPPTDQVGKFSYFCVVSDAFDLVSLTSDTVNVQVLPYLVITSQPQGAQYAQGETAAPLTMAAEGENLSYQWYIYSGVPGVENTRIEGATAASYTPPTDTLGTVSYFCEVSSIVNNERNPLTTQVATVEVSQGLSITTQPQSAQYTQNASATPLTVVVAQGENLSYQWYSQVGEQAGVLIEGATGASYTPPTATLGTVAYFCEVKGTLNGLSSTVRSQSATVEVLAAPLALGSNDADSYSYAWGAQPTALTVTASGGTEPYSYQWYKNNTPINGANAASYTPESIGHGSDLAITDTYHCVVADASAATAQSKTITLVWDHPAPPAP